MPAAFEEKKKNHADLTPKDADVERRRFLKSAALGAAGLGIGSIVALPLLDQVINGLASRPNPSLFKTGRNSSPYNGLQTQLENTVPITTNSADQNLLDSTTIPKWVNQIEDPCRLSSLQISKTATETLSDKNTRSVFPRLTNKFCRPPMPMATPRVSGPPRFGLTAALQKIQ